MMLTDQELKEQGRQRIEILMQEQGTSPDVQDMIRRNLDFYGGDFAALLITACEGWKAWAEENQMRILGHLLNK